VLVETVSMRGATYVALPISMDGLACPMIAPNRPGTRVP
jgi:hypothetical protein